jgi:hypothetical protein
MEADWEFEVGGDAPVIDACWAGLIDLRCNPERAWQLPETAQFPALAAALAKLNAPASPAWTSKCDLWTHLEAGEFDPDEMAAPPGSAAHAMGCYIDLLPGSGRNWIPPELASAECQRVCGFLSAAPLPCCRADLIIRRAFIAPDREELGITAYLTACGNSPTEAAQVLQSALVIFADAFRGHSTIE